MKLHRKKSTIFARLLLPMVIVAAIQSAVFMWIILLGGVAERLDKNAYDILSQQAANRTNTLEKTIASWSQLTDAGRSISRIYDIKGGVDPQPDGTVSREKSQVFLQDVSAELISLLRQNKVNGAYLILTGGSYALPAKGESVSRYGVCIRDMDPESGNKQNGDLLIERAPSVVASSLSLALDAWWESTYTLTGEETSDFYFKPLLAAGDNKSLESEDYRYWSKPYQLSGDDTEMLSCSMPLFTEAGEVFAILGIEVKSTYFTSQLPSEEMGVDGTGVYALALRQENTLWPILTNGFMSSRYIENDGVITLSKNYLSGNSYTAVSNESMQLAAAVGDLHLYSKNSPFQNDQYCLLALVDQDALLSFSRDMRGFVLLASAFSLVLSLLGAFVVGKYFTYPIKKLAARVRRGGSTSRNLESVQIAEIDELVEAIQSLHRDISQSESKTTDIIRMSGLMVGTFEIDRTANRAFADKEFFQIMGAAAPLREQLENPVLFEQSLAAFQKYLVAEDTENDTHIYRVGDKWIKMKTNSGEQKTLGILLDVTAEMNERQKIEYERDHDLLTGLFNRRAFHRSIGGLFASVHDLGVAAMVMMDVDNLKYVNDSFGHDSGDTYLRLVGDVLKTVIGDNSLVARISGDEFLVFLYHAADQDEILRRVGELRERMGAAYMKLPGGDQLRARVSGGIAWYPEDSNEQNSLIKFADFAMLQSKRNQKGSFTFFKIEEYRENRHLVESVDEIYRLFETKNVDFFFQPIVNVRTGEIHAYEALMRPLGETIKSPAEALSLAKAAGCLYHMERLTWMGVLEKISENLPLFGNARLFINSIPNQSLNKDDFKELTASYGALLKRIVVEITEEEKAEEEARIRFLQLKKAGIEIAIDDYGSGYNGQVMLLDFNPGYVKVDMSIVRGVTSDKNRQEVISSLVRYGGERNIRIIAEGVETHEELKCLVGLGVEYVQGYILQKPSPLPLPLSNEARAALASVY